MTSYVVKDCVWPTQPIDQSIKDVIILYYELSDWKDDQAGPRQAQDVFTADAVIEGVSGTYRGSEAIAGSRKMAWGIFSERAHYVNRVYTIDETGRDLMLMGSVSMDLKIGTHLDLPYAVRLTIDEASHKAGKPKINLFQVMTDSVQVTRANKKA